MPFRESVNITGVELHDGLKRSDRKASIRKGLKCFADGDTGVRKEKIWRNAQEIEEISWLDPLKYGKKGRIFVKYSKLTPPRGYRKRSIRYPRRGLPAAGKL